jgi:hypothetical protein
LPNLSPYINDVKISGFTRISIIYTYDISRLRVKEAKFVLELAMNAQRENTSIALFFLLTSHVTPPEKKPGAHCTGGRTVPRAGLNRSGKSRPQRDSIPEQSSP